MVTRISMNAVRVVQESEGVKLTPYLDPVGIPTIGYGSTRYEDGRKVTMSDPPITMERATMLLMVSMNVVAAQVVGLMRGIQVTQNQFDALCSLVYNIGIGNFMSSTIYRTMKSYGPNKVTLEMFKMWNKGGRPLRELPGLTTRRTREFALYNV